MLKTVHAILGMSYPLHNCMVLYKHVWCVHVRVVSRDVCSHASYGDHGVDCRLVCYLAYVCFLFPSYVDFGISYCRIEILGSVIGFL